MIQKFWNLSLFCKKFGIFGLRKTVEFSATNALQGKKLWIPLLGLCLRKKYFEDISIHNLTCSWDACFRRKWAENQIKGSSWMPPLHGVLKLNFAWRFLNEKHKGGYGRIIRNSFGQVLCSFSGPVGCEDTKQRCFQCLWDANCTSFKLQML